MTTSPRQSRAARVVLFGMRCTFTGPVLAALAAAPGIDLEAVVLPGRAPGPQRARHEPVSRAIEAFRLPLVEIPERRSLFHNDFRATLEEIAPETIIVACFPWRLPAWILSLPPHGCLNVHPSLLPEGRGPEPVFWAFRRGLDETGVTLHQMDAGLDTGPIISQVPVPIPDGETIPSLERSLAEIGAGLVLDHLHDTFGRLRATPQQDGGEYAPHVRGEDLVVSTSWAVNRAARFIHAVAPVYGAVPVVVHATAQRLLVEEVMGVDDGEGDGRPVVIQGDTARVRFATGTLRCRIQRETRPLALHP